LRNTVDLWQSTAMSGPKENDVEALLKAASKKEDCANPRTTPTRLVGANGGEIGTYGTLA
jgi:hypothetical protein